MKRLVKAERRLRLGLIAICRRRTVWKTVGRIVGLLLAAGSAYYLVRTVWQHLGEIGWSSLHLAPGPLLASLGLTTLCVMAGGWTWQLVLGSLGYVLPLTECLRIHTTSNLAKYIPGYAWQLLGKAYLTRRQEIPTAVVSFGVLLEMGCLLLTGILVALVFMPEEAQLPLVGSPSAIARIGLASCVVVVLVALSQSPRIFSGKRRRPKWLVVLQHPTRLWLALLVMAGAWVLFGIAFGCLARALADQGVVDWGLSIYALTASFLVSLAALFVPGGLGVREGIMVYALSSRLPTGRAALVAILSRLVLTASELLAFGLSWLWQATHPHHNASITQKD